MSKGRTDSISEVTHQIIMAAINDPKMGEYVFEGWSGKKRPDARHITYYTLESKSERPSQSAIDNEDGKFKVFQFRESWVQVDFWGSGAFDYMCDLYLKLSTERVRETCRQLNCYIVEIENVRNINHRDNDTHNSQRAMFRMYLRYVVAVEDKVDIIEQVDFEVKEPQQLNKKGDIGDGQTRPDS